MGKDIGQAVREIVFSLPETEEVLSHGSPSFRVRGRTFATFTVNHHGDGRVALNVQAPPGAQQLCTERDPEHYFVPAYTGPRGWLGIDLNKGLSWKAIAARVREAYEAAAPPELTRSLGDTIEIDPPDRPMRPEEIDLFLRPRATEVLARLARICESLPETSRDRQFGNPVWKAGRRTFVGSQHRQGRLHLSFWVGADRQTFLEEDPRYCIPAYTGHNGWIDLDVEDRADWNEIEDLVMDSYRHFALKRMLRSLGEA